MKEGTENTGVSVLDVLGIDPTVSTGKSKGEQKSFGRVNITGFRKGAWHIVGGERVDYEKAGNYDRMIQNAGIPDNPDVLMDVCDRLLTMVANGELVKPE